MRRSNDTVRRRGERERARSGHDEHSLVWEGIPVNDPLRQDGLAKPRLPRASRWFGVRLPLPQGRQQRNTCGFCGGDVGEKCKTWVVEAKTGKAAPQIHSTCSLAPKVDSRSTRVALGLKALLKPTSSTPCTNAPLKCLFCSPDKWVWNTTPCPTT